MWVNPSLVVSRAPRFAALLLILLCISVSTLAQTSVGNGSHGTLRVDLAVDLPAGMHATEARNADGSVAVVVFNGNADAVGYEVEADGTIVESVIAGDAIQTIVLD